MAPKRVDLDDLVDTDEIATMLDWVGGNSVNVYRRRHPDDFPAPIVTKGRCNLWLRSDVEAWALRTGRVKRL